MNQRVYRIEISHPPKEVRPNRRRSAHWAAQAKATREYRAESALACVTLLKGERPEFPVGSVVATFKHRDRRTIMDNDNALASLKSAFDGMQDGGLLSDDKRLVHWPVVQVVEKGCEPTVELIFVSGEVSFPDIEKLPDQ